MLDRDSQPLQAEVSSRSAITAARRERNHRFMDQTAEQETEQQRQPRIYDSRRRQKQESMRQISEGPVPAPAPEIAQAGRGPGMTHDGQRVVSDTSPQTAQQMEQTEVQHKNNPDHADPAACELVAVHERPAEAEQSNSEYGFCRGAQPCKSRRLDHMD